MTIYSWMPAVENTYAVAINTLRQMWLTQKWLGKDLNASSLDEAANDGRPDVSDESPDSIGGQFYVFMPGHSYKVEQLIAQLSMEHKLPITTNNSCLVIVDIGCGGGAASLAVINTVLNAKTRDLKLIFIGVEINQYAIQLYDLMLTTYENNDNSGVAIKHHTIIKGIPEAITYVAEGINQAQKEWKIPHISDLWIIQSNVVRPLANQHKADVTTRKELQFSETKSLIPDDFGLVEARAYDQLFRLSRADRLILFTVATVEKVSGQLSATQVQRNNVAQFSKTLMEGFSQHQHQIKDIVPIQDVAQPLTVNYINPLKSFWRNKNPTRPAYTAIFYANVKFVENQEFLSDEDWQQIISLENLRLAWMRVRAAMMQDSLTDEIGIDLFSVQVDKRLSELRRHLLTYSVDLHSFPRFYYESPKNGHQSRQRGLQSIEEEILAVACLQVLGNKVRGLMTHNFAYRLSELKSSEFMYRSWYVAYRKYSDSIRKYVKGHDENVQILRTDITKFFNNISQRELLKALLSHFQASKNARIQWLLNQLIIRHIEGHYDGYGLMQGPIASGFLANLFLLTLDQKFSDERTDNVTLFVT